MNTTQTKKINYQDFITIHPEIRFGKPCIKGTRITVYDVLGWFAAEMTIQGIMEDFPELSEIQIKACLLYAADKERKIQVISV